MNKSMAFALFCFSSFLLICDRVVITDLKQQLAESNKQIGICKDRMSKGDTNVQKAMNLLAVREWFIVDENTVSVKPNGEGGIVKFVDSEKLKPQTYERGLAKCPYPNNKVVFKIPSLENGYGAGGKYLVKKGLLTYELK